MKYPIIFALSFGQRVLSSAVPQHYEHLPLRLLPRAEQDVKNLDDEKPFKEADGTEVPKSRILTGLNQESEDRWFDWDESCTSSEDRAKILATFHGVMELSQLASGYLEDLSKALPEPVRSKRTEANIDYIRKEDPAYTQMFGSKNGWDQRIGNVKQTFDLITSKGQSFEGRNGDKPPALRFICDPKGIVRTGKDEKTLKDEPRCAPDDQAITISIYDPKLHSALPPMEPKYSFVKSQSIIFCPKFFTDFPNLSELESLDQPTLDQVDCRERILLHEYTHLKWIRNLRPKYDEIGFYKAAQVTALGWDTNRKNPDNYAWYAVYAYFNNKNQVCGRDAWPAKPKKPIT